MNRKTGAVSSSTVTRRARQKVERLSEMRDNCSNLTAFQRTLEREHQDVGEFFEESLNCTDEPTCRDAATGVVFREDGGMEVKPGPDWKMYDVRVIKSCGNCLETRHGLKKSCNTSDLQSEEAIQIKREPKQIHIFGDSDDDNEKKNPPKKKARGLTTSSTVAPPPPLPLSPSPPPLESRRPAGEQTPSASQVYRPTWREGRCGSDTIVCSAAEAHIMSLLENMKHQQDLLITRVNYLTNMLHPTGQEVEVTDPEQFPLNSLEEVVLFEDRLKDPLNSQLKKSVISSLATIGGHDTKHVTRNILARMFSDDVGKRINWKGVNGKKSFSQMESKTLLLHAVRKNHVSCDATDDEILKHAIRWFNLAADRGSSRRRVTVRIPTEQA
ncbi:uncharacterized protein LOC142951527 [Anarhichas minor]|uniref:uncharacterized protein LOC142951527 n=1 Tax=Anarhichas minor TaxID=65739 RepID=UPI003F73327A